VPRSAWRRIRVAADDLLWSHADLAGLLRDRVSNGAYDLAWISGGGTMNPHFPQGTSLPVLADVVDSLALTQYRELRRARGPIDKLRHAKRLVSTVLFERKYLGHADHALFVSEDDASTFRRVCPRVPVSVVHNGVDPERFQATGLPRRNPWIVFEGNMGFAPNVDGAAWFCRDVFPLIVRRRPDVRLWLVGKDPTPAVRDLAGDRVRVTGTVDDVRPWLDQAAVFVCPMRSGAGIKNKILQAWSMALPVVTTTIATGGLEVADGNNLLVEDDPVLFAERVVALLNDPDLAARIGQAGRATILRSYTWQQKSRELERVFAATARRELPPLEHKREHEEFV
jgi:glycosyltransferase involved in cell wall biosynthesis